MRLLLLFLLLTLTAPALRAGEHYYELNPAAEAIYARVMRLELDGATADLEDFRRRYPTNLAAAHLESYVDFFRLYLSGDEDLDEELEARYAARQAELEKGEDDDPYFRYAQAENRLHRSLILIRFERQLAAFRELNKANKLLRENAKRFPDFLLTYKDLGLLHAAVGSIPPQYKWGVELFSSLSGSVEEGRREIRRALEATDSPFHQEAQVLYAYLELHLADRPEVAWRSVSKLNFSPGTNPLHCFVLANLAMHNGLNDRAITLLEGQPRGGASADFPYLDFMLGLTRLRTLDPSARVYFQSFLLRYPGRHFKEEALQKIAWAYLLRGDGDQYLATMRRVSGGSQAGGDENASREAARDRLPNVPLLKARLLFDGNYCARARKILDAIDPTTLGTQEHLEYLYRTGRVLDGLEDYPGALSFYQRTVTLGRDNPAYFACRAALQAGLIEEKRGNKAAAKAHYSTCLDISPEEYRTGLHLLANAGLNRLK